MNKTLSPAAAALVAAVALLGACASPSKVTQATPTSAMDTGTPAGGAGAGAGAAAGGTPQSSVSTVDLANRADGSNALNAALAQRIVYFDFDSFAIKDEYKPVLDGHARVLSRENAKRLVIEGHTDERGGREYNLALGQKRAESVLRSLALLGVQDKQLEAVSFGEERPAATGADESTWAKNRRAELKDR
ncbi:MAG: peptidoglycan-associated lipoprotein Pal [Rubrivivax sp.]|nr:peptidoglycan-associated lipoprotein Pal [Rubrivivax sp.]